MHAQSLEQWTHEHVFLGPDHRRNEGRTQIVIVLCGAMMVAEIVGGLLFRSMALVADGLHMSTHAAALLIAALGYTFARRRAHDARFTFGTGKFGDLAGFTSAIVLATIALLIGWESVGRLLHPVSIAFDEAIPIAMLGLGVNLVSAWLLRDEHDHRPEAAGDHHQHHDLNLRAAYIHVMADAAVSNPRGYRLGDRSGIRLAVDGRDYGYYRGLGNRELVVASRARCGGGAHRQPVKCRSCFADPRSPRARIGPRRGPSFVEDRPRSQRGRRDARVASAWGPQRLQETAGYDPWS